MVASCSAVAVFRLTGAAAVAAGFGAGVLVWAFSAVALKAIAATAAMIMRISICSSS
jgi:hypothetical protein